MFIEMMVILASAYRSSVDKDKMDEERLLIEIKVSVGTVAERN